MKSKVLKQQPFFNPSDIVTTISQAISRDLTSRTHEYAGSEALSYFVDRQLKEFTKKYVNPEVGQEALEELTYKKFLKVNEHMGKYSKKRYPDPTTRIQRSIAKRDKILLRARALMHSILGDITQDEWFLECKNSGGSSIGVPFYDTSIEKKFTLPLSTTERAKTMFNHYLAFDNTLKDSIQKMNGPITGWYKVLHGSRASTVEKNDSIRRMICIEPVVNMYLQQGLMSVFYRRMKVIGLDVETLPSEHKVRAKTSSLTSREATIDWSSASDCVSTELLRYILPPKWFYCIDICRSPSTEINGEVVDLNMFSTMGNAVTFPLETLVFFVFAHAVMLSSDIHNNSLFPEWDRLKEVSVFGDDCILPTEHASDFIEAMTDVGFLINTEKSYFGNEQFRESCGGDYLAWTNVRPFYIKAPTATKKSALEPWLYIITNSIKELYLRLFGELSYVYYSQVWTELFSIFAKYRIDICLIPSDFPDDSGLKISDDIARFSHLYRFSLRPIYRDRHGSVCFHFKRFKYWNKKDMYARLRYATLLKEGFNVVKNDTMRILSGIEVTGREKPRSILKCAGDSSPQLAFRPVRRKGGYVEAKAVTSHWDVTGIVNAGLHRNVDSATKNKGSAKV